ncbi:hypothetical protein N7462_011119 [Penicillium macrosclerotiorum]|uniref:uncharacterized protein n=1 Tax=Penicillium macrosclerotiorum TaxID=303699 RepID=UPI002546E328|nr:uncharacterized protein N7462_011119 [Penicillium macrosclerotiorum]KAJ5666710.1 hypothetical protein N7462_011119 [Penicillium macrosclerotiorum]
MACNKKLWGHGCQPNTSELGTACHELDDRFTRTMADEGHSPEGHTRRIFVKSNGTTIFNGLFTHPSMDDVATIVNAILAVRQYIPELRNEAQPWSWVIFWSTLLSLIALKYYH